MLRIHFLAQSRCYTSFSLLSSLALVKDFQVWLELLLGLVLLDDRLSSGVFCRLQLLLRDRLFLAQEQLLLVWFIELVYPLAHDLDARLLLYDLVFLLDLSFFLSLVALIPLVVVHLLRKWLTLVKLRLEQLNLWSCRARNWHIACLVYWLLF